MRKKEKPVKLFVNWIKYFSITIEGSHTFKLIWLTVTYVILKYNWIEQGLKERLRVSPEIKDDLNEFRDGRGTGTENNEAKKLQQISVIDRELSLPGYSTG